MIIIIINFYSLYDNTVTSLALIQAKLSNYKLMPQICGRAVLKFVCEAGTRAANLTLDLTRRVAMFVNTGMYM